MISLKRILVPHDFSETSEAAVRYGIEFARKFGAQLHLLHVGAKERSEMDMEFPLGLEDAARDAIRERLLKIVTPHEYNDLKPAFAVLSGVPYVEIVRYAKEQDIDLIVMGTHGRGFVAHAVMGSVAEKVVRYAPCPVLTIHSAQHEFVIPDEAERSAPVIT